MDSSDPAVGVLGTSSPGRNEKASASGEPTGTNQKAFAGNLSSAFLLYQTTWTPVHLFYPDAEEMIISNTGSCWGLGHRFSRLCESPALYSPQPAPVEDSIVLVSVALQSNWKLFKPWGLAVLRLGLPGSRHSRRGIGVSSCSEHLDRVVLKCSQVVQGCLLLIEGLSRWSDWVQSCRNLQNLSSSWVHTNLMGQNNYSHFTENKTKALKSQDTCQQWHN